MVYFSLWLLLFPVLNCYIKQRKLARDQYKKRDIQQILIAKSNQFVEYSRIAQPTSKIIQNVRNFFVLSEASRGVPVTDWLLPDVRNVLTDRLHFHVEVIH